MSDPHREQALQTLRQQAATPAVAVFACEPSVRVVDFVSDLHLCADMPKTAAAFLDYLAKTRCDALVLLGDIFEVWVGDDMGDGEFESSILAALARFSAARPLLFMVGNRDFLVGPATLQRAGATGLSDPALLDCQGHRLLLSHGDALCLADLRYQAFRQQVRQPAWRAAVLAKPLGERLALARSLREGSQHMQADPLHLHADADPDLVAAWLSHAGSSTMIHGHTHRPADHVMPNGRRRIVLSDWDLDHDERAEVLRFIKGEFQRLQLAEI